MPTLQAEPAIIVGDNAESKRFHQPPIEKLKNRVDITCAPAKICLRIDNLWFNFGIPNDVIDYLGSPLEFTEFIDPSDGIVMNDISFPPYLTPRFVQSAFLSTLLPSMACPVIDQKIVKVNGKDFWEGCVNIEVATHCFQRTIDANNTRASFATWFETRNTEVKSNFAFPLQCSYFLKYNVDLYLGTVSYDDNGNPIFTPSNQNSYADCQDSVVDGVMNSNPFCNKDGSNVPGFYRPLFDMQNITIITTSATDKGTFPVYLFMYETEQYLTPYTAPPIKKETEKVFLETGIINPISDAVMKTKQCWATPSAEMNLNDPTFMLIEDFCPTAEAVEQINFQGVFDNGQAIKNRFSHEIFAFKKFDSQLNKFIPHPKLYIFCKVSICIQDLNGPCDVTADDCSDEKRRRKRSTNDREFFSSQTLIDGEKLIKIGPIYPDEFSKNGHSVTLLDAENTRTVYDSVISDQINQELKNTVRTAEDRLAQLKKETQPIDKNYMAVWVILLVTAVVGILLVLMFSYWRFNKRVNELSMLSPTVSSVSLAK